MRVDCRAALKEVKPKTESALWNVAVELCAKAIAQGEAMVDWETIVKKYEALYGASKR